MSAVTYMIGVLIANQLWKKVISESLKRQHGSKIKERKPSVLGESLFIDPTSLFHDDENSSACSDTPCAPRHGRQRAETALENLHHAPDVFGVKGHGVKAYRDRAQSSFMAHSEFLRSFRNRSFSEHVNPAGGLTIPPSWNRAPTLRTTVNVTSPCADAPSTPEGQMATSPRGDDLRTH